MTDLMPAVAPAEVELPVSLPSPAPDNPEEALEWLGSTVEEVAEGLRARGIKGVVGDGNNCPLARYIQEWWPDGWVALGKWSRSDTIRAEGHCPSICHKFEAQFDAGAFPDLIDT